MKNLALTVMGLVVAVLVFSACSGYDDEFIIDPQPQPTTNNDTIPENKNDDNDDTWETPLDDWYEMLNGNTLIDSHKKTSKKEYNVQAPFSATLGGDLYFILDNDNSRSSFISLAPVSHMNTSYGEWYSNQENDSIREVISNQEYKCNLYVRSLVIKNAQAYRFLNGQRDPFEMPIVVSSFAGHSSDVQEIERNDSIFNRETIKDSVRIAFGERPDIAPFFVSARTVIDHFVKVKENNETMPEPSFYVEGEIQWISDRTASPEFTTSNKTHAIWYEVSVIKTTVKTYVVANGQLKDGWNNSELANAEWNSAILDKGYTNKWVPATINMDGSGWTYVLQFSNNEYRPLTVPENLSLMTDLKTFKEDDNASQTPFLTKGVNKRHYSNGDFYTVTGKYSYTVAAE